MTDSALHYFPYGATRAGAPAALPTEFNFTGQRLDMSTGLLYYGARYYDPALGRFISADPIVPRPGAPQNLNRYSYVRNNPLRYVDPSGYVDNEDHLERDVDVIWRVLYAARTLYGVPIDPKEAKQTTNWSTATLRDVHTWLQRGVEFKGLAWKNSDFREVTTALNRVQNALGRSRTTRLLGLGRGPLTFNKIPAGTRSSGGGSTVNISFYSQLSRVETVIHDLVFAQK